MNERKEPDLGRFEDLGNRDRIPTLTELAVPMEGAPGRDDPRVRENPSSPPEGSGPAGPESPMEPPHPFVAERRSETAPAIGDADIEAAADRVLDQLAPVLRERIAQVLTELLAAARRDRL
jgi:hypothetical protein